VLFKEQSDEFVATIFHGNDLVNREDDPVNPENDLVNKKNDPVNTPNDLVNKDNDPVKPENDLVNQRENDLLNLIKDDQKITYEEMAEKLKVSVVTIKREVKKLKDNKFLEREESDKSGSWVIIK
jgi:predicted HTH transcriptional regulator